MMRGIRLLAAYTRRSALEWLGYRSFLTTLIFNNSIAPVLGLALWTAALPGQRDISAYFLVLLVVQWATASQEYYSLTMTIYEGDLADDLLRPHAAIVRPIAEGIAYRCWNLAVGLPFLAIAIMLTGRHGMEGNAMLRAIPALVLAVLVHFAFTCALCLSALWLQQAGAVTDIGSTLVFLLGGIAIPLMLLPESVKPIVEALPFRSMAGFPAEIASGHLSTSQLASGFAWQCWWLLVFGLLAAWLWRVGIRHYSAVGG